MISMCLVVFFLMVSIKYPIISLQLKLRKTIEKIRIQNIVIFGTIIVMKKIYNEVGDKSLKCRSKHIVC